MTDGGGRPPRLATLAAGDLSPSQRAEIVRVCTAAFGEDFGELFDLLPGSIHVLAREGWTLVGHGCWVERRLEPAGLAPLRTAYVEAVATRPDRQGRGIGSAVMRRIAEEIVGDGYDLGALSPATPGFYARLGWEAWRGPTAIRSDVGPIPTPGDEIMVLRTPRTPPLDLDAPITAEWREGELW